MLKTFGQSICFTGTVIQLRSQQSVVTLFKGTAYCRHIMLLNHSLKPCQLKLYGFTLDFANLRNAEVGIPVAAANLLDPVKCIDRTN